MAAGADAVGRPGGPAAPAGAGGPPAAGRPDVGERRELRARLYVAGDAP
jgi:hypothetical protein